MNSLRLILAITILAFFAILTVSPVNAGSMGNGAAQRMKLVVDSIDTAGGTIVLKSGVDGSVHTYKVSATTQIVLLNKKATLDQVQPGMKVGNFNAAAGDPPQTLKMLMVYSAPAK